MKKASTLLPVYYNANTRYESAEYLETKIEKLDTILGIRGGVLGTLYASHSQTAATIQALGYTVKWCRIPVSGGVGAVWWLPKFKVWRMQVSAASWPWRHARSAMVGGGVVFYRAKPALKYAWCVEV